LRKDMAAVPLVLANLNSNGGHWHERNRYGGRLQVLLKSQDNLSLKLNLDGAFTDENSNTKIKFTRAAIHRVVDDDRSAA